MKAWTYLSALGSTQTTMGCDPFPIIVYRSNFANFALKSKDDPCWTCCKAPPKLELEHSHLIEPSTMKEASVIASSIKDATLVAGTVDVCLKLCFDNKPTCAEGWVRKFRARTMKIC